MSTLFFTLENTLVSFPCKPSIVPFCNFLSLKDEDIVIQMMLNMMLKTKYAE